MQKLLRHALWTLPLSSVIDHIHLPLPFLSLLVPLTFLLSFLSDFPHWIAFLFSKKSWLTHDFNMALDDTVS